MENRISKIDPKEFGLNENQVQTIEQAFMPKIVERDGLKTIYEQLITSEITPELCQQAYSLRNKLVKVRTGIADIHKTQKAFYLAAGRFVDEWKNKETLPVTQMEESLYEIESFYEKQEAERIEKLHKERLELLQPFIDETIFVPSDLGNMQADIWNNFFIGTKVSFEQKQAAIKKAEEDRLAKIEAERIENERIRKENERLQKENEAKERQLQFERQQAEKLAEIERKKQSDILKAQQEKADKERKENELKLEAERKESQRLADELKAKKDAEENDRKAKELAEKKAQAAPDKDKLSSAINSIEWPQLNLTTEQSKMIEQFIIEKFEGFKKWATIEINKL